jgi:asparagine synthase (glutamine-hydrolysing)
MCGIAGHLTRGEHPSRGVAKRQVGLVCHRGPDSAGLHEQGPAIIGQSRLAVIDLITGDPPIVTPDQRVGAVLNGEIYNYRELRQRLLADGHALHTMGDTEVIAELATVLEPVALARRLHGMFAFATWDAQRQRLVLGRDRVGKKPLYYWEDGRTLVFGSEIKSVLAHPAVPSRLADDVLPTYLGFGYVPSPQTFYEGVRSLPPGHVLVVEGSSPAVLEPYWEPSVPGLGETTRLPLSEREAAQQVREHLDAAVARRMVADVPLGAFLSGGVDSSAVVAMMARHSTQPVRTFTIGFEDQAGFDERPYAAEVARHLGTEHTEFVVEPNAVDLVEKLVWHHDQPFGDSSAIPTYLLSELTAGEVTVAMAGDGGDELFAGYERFPAGVAASVLSRAPGTARRAATGALLRVPASAGGTRAAKFARFLAAADRGMPDAYRSWISYVPDEVVDRLVPTGSRWGRDDYTRIWDETAGARALDRLLLLNLRTYLLDDLLPKVDRMSMAHGLEVRAPFLDHEFVEFALRLPPRVKARGLSLKRCLKAGVEDMLPPGLFDRPKRGFGVPLDRWFREDLAPYVDTMLGSPSARLRAHVDGVVLDELLAQQARGERQHGHALWTLLTLEVFLRDRDW